MLAEKLSLQYHSTGEVFRVLAKEKGMSLEEFTEYVEEHPQIDKELDARIVELAKQENVIIDSRLSSYLLKDVAHYKFLLTCDEETRIQRMMERDEESFEEKLHETRRREESEEERFQELYGIDLSNERQRKDVFDLIIDTTHLSIEEVIHEILLFIRNPHPNA